MRRVLLLFLISGAFVLAPGAAWASGVDVIRDCTDNGRIDDQHGPKDYSDALANLPSDVDEYTDCRQIISDARRSPPPAQAHNGDSTPSSGGGSGGGGGSKGLKVAGAGSGKSSAAKAAAARKATPPPQGPPIIPPADNLAAKPAGRGVPTPLVVTAALLALAAALWLVARARGRRPSEPLGKVVHRVFPRRA